MKTIKFLINFMALTFLCLLFACTQERSECINETKNVGRIILKETRVIDGYSFYIIEVDSIEFLAQYHGGFVKISR